MGIGTKGVHVSELKYKTCPARWIYFCVSAFPGFIFGVSMSNPLSMVVCQRPGLDTLAYERHLDLTIALAHHRSIAEDLIS